MLPFKKRKTILTCFPYSRVTADGSCCYDQACFIIVQTALGEWD